MRRGGPGGAAEGGLFRKRARRLDALLQHLGVADLVGQQQDQSGVEERRLFGREALVRVQQLFVERVGILQVKAGFHHRAVSSSAPSALPTARTSVASTPSPVAAT